MVRFSLVMSLYTRIQVVSPGGMYNGGPGDVPLITTLIRDSQAMDMFFLDTRRTLSGANEVSCRIMSAHAVPAAVYPYRNSRKSRAVDLIFAGGYPRRAHAVMDSGGVFENERVAQAEINSLIGTC